MAGVCSVALVPERVRGEVIQVYGCAPGWIEFGAGENLICLADPSWTDPRGRDWSDRGDDTGGDGGGGGGDTKPVRDDSWNQLEWDEIVRKWRCGQCKVSANKCIAQARLKEDTCGKNARTQAQWRCDIGERRAAGSDTATVWGCSIDVLLRGLCGAAEAPWNDKKRWGYSCDPVGSESSLHGKSSSSSLVGSWEESDSHKNMYRCHGPGVSHCEQSWAVSHPGGSTQVVDTQEFSAMFEGVGGAQSQTVTATFALTPLKGYTQACTDMGDVLAAGCTSKEGACYSEYSCTEADLP